MAVKFCIKRNQNKSNLLNLTAAEEERDEQLPASQIEQLNLFDRLEKLGLPHAQAKKYSKDIELKMIKQI